MFYRTMPAISSHSLTGYRYIQNASYDFRVWSQSFELWTCDYRCSSVVGGCGTLERPLGELFTSSCKIEITKWSTTSPYRVCYKVGMAVDVHTKFQNLGFFIFIKRLAFLKQYINLLKLINKTVKFSRISILVL